jgi:hypothetical protein
MKNIILFKAVLIAAFTLISTHLLAENSEGEAKLVDRFPMHVIDRPAVTPTGIFNIDTNIDFTNKNGVPKTIGVSFKSQFGIVKNLEGQFNLAGFKINGEKDGKDELFLMEKTVTLGAKYNYFNIPHVSFSATASLPIHVMDGEIIKNIVFGTPITFYNHIVAGGILGNVFNLTMRKNVAAAFEFDYWFGAQVYGDLWMMVDSSFGKITMENENNQAKWVTQGFWQKLPATLSATYAINHNFDLGANFGFKDVFKAKENLIFGITFSAHGGRIFG